MTETTIRPERAVPDDAAENRAGQTAAGHAAGAELDVGELRRAIQAEYTEVAVHPERPFHFHTGRRLAAILEYRDEWLDGVPQAALESLARPGQTINHRPRAPRERGVGGGGGGG